MKGRLWLLRLAFAAAVGGAWPAVAAAGPSVWMIDDGEKIRRDDTSTPFERGEENPIWRPGEPARLFAMQNESIAVQVVVEADGEPLEAVTVELRDLHGPGGTLAEMPLAPADAGRVVGRPIERFVEHFVHVARASGGPTPGESLGWDRGSGPDERAWVGDVPDALIPVEVAPAWSAYPMRIEPHTNGIVWIDVNVPYDLPSGVYRGVVDVRNGAAPLAAMAIELDVAGVRLPAPSSGAMVYYDPEELARRVGPGAEEHLWKMLHAHRVAPLHDLQSVADVERQRGALDGSLYDPAHGYLGPEPGVGDGVASIGAFGDLGDPDAAAEAKVTAIADALAADRLLDRTGAFVYAADEDCDSPRGAAWTRWVHASSDENVRRLRVAWTCSNDPSAQPVDVAIVDSTYRESRARAAERLGKSVWVYNGMLPRTGTFLVDADAVSPRVNGWLGAIDAIPRWFYWESTYWYGRHGRVPVDPFFDAESFHDDDGDWADGDGVLLYPGTQRDFFSDHSLGLDGVVASIRLKNWRRGIEDAGYYRLAAARDPRRARSIALTLLPAAFDQARSGRRAAWSPRGKAFFDARRDLLQVAMAPPGAVSSAEHERRASGGWTLRTLFAGGKALAVAASGVLALAIGVFWNRRRTDLKRPH